MEAASDLKSKPTQKLDHANFILEYFEYFCQMSSKLIVIILSYTVSKFSRFSETQCSSVSKKIVADKKNPSEHSDIIFIEIDQHLEKL